MHDDTGDGGHYITARTFGPVTFTAFHIPAWRKTKYHASQARPGDPPEAA